MTERLFPIRVAEETEGVAGQTVEERLQRTISGRSLYRLARSLRLVPDCMASGEFHDLVHELYIHGSKAPEKRYFKELTMLQSEEEPDIAWVQPAVGTMPGEPRAAGTLTGKLSFVTIPVWQDSAFRISWSYSPWLPFTLHPNCMLNLGRNGWTVCMRYLKISCTYQWARQNSNPQLQPLSCLAGWFVQVDLNAEDFLQVVSGYLDQAKEKEPSNLVEIWAELNSELPKLAPKKDPYIPQPSAQVLEKLPPQPLTADQRLDENQRKNPFGRAAPGKKKGKKKAKVKQPKWREYFYGNLPVTWNQIQWLGKRPDPPRPEIPAMWQVDSKVAMLKNLDDHIGRHRDESQAVNTPASGWDEPLKAPLCPHSEEVSTLMQTALTSRRLKQYDAAMTLLIRARKLWATIEATGCTPREWQDVQPLIPAPSPWNPTGSQSSSGAFPNLAARRAAQVQRSHDEDAATVDPPEERKHHYVKSKTDVIVPGPSNNIIKTHTEGDLGTRTWPLNRSPSASEGGKTPPSRGRGGSRTPSDAANSTRPYNPNRDFSAALGDGEEDLDLLPPQAMVFFFCEMASLHSALQEDELLSPHDANAAMVWGGLGRVAFYSGSFEAAARLYMRARSIREKALGGDTIDTATAYNNLACCLAALDRPVEAAAYSELSVEILKELAGEDHPRTHTAMRNLGKVRTAPKKIAMEAPCLYSLPLRVFVAGERKRKRVAPSLVARNVLKKLFSIFKKE
eukprot:symbB.v1.2.040269.t1/scaffold7113.1/size13259/2